MIRKNPRGDLPVVDVSAFVDPTAVLCGRVIVRENVFIGPFQDGLVIDLASVPKGNAQASEFSEDVVRTNNSLVQGYMRIQNEL